MTRERAKELVRDFLHSSEWLNTTDIFDEEAALIEFALRVQRETREECAKVAERFDGAFVSGTAREREWSGGSNFASVKIAAAIRAMEDKS